MNQPSHTHTKHIPRLDSLRAIAVVAVVIFHFSPRALPWGFLGVDMFFTISGFLMTYLSLQAAPNSNGLDVAWQFLKRRFWRIYPSLIITIFFSVVLAFLFFSPEHLNQTAKSGLFATVALSNWDFYYQSNYFDIGSIYKPLLHTWSLGVEEQFYALFAVLLVFNKWINLRTGMILLAVFSMAAWFLLALINFAPHLLGFQFHEEPTSALFFMPQYRAFQFALGGVAASVMLKNIVIPKWSEFIGLIAIAAGCALGSDESLAHWSSLPMTVGMVIFVSRSASLDYLSTLAPVRYIARISYQLYLVHWPIIVIWHYITLSPLSLLEIAIGTLLCLIFADLLFRVTDPMRLTR